MIEIDEIEKKVKSIFADRLDMPEEEIRSSSSLRDDLGVDSYGMIEIALDLEGAFHINIMKDRGVFPRIKTVRDAAEYIKKKLCGNKLE